MITADELKAINTFFLFFNVDVYVNTIAKKKIDKTPYVGLRTDDTLFGDVNTKDMSIVNTKSNSGASKGLLHHTSLRVVRIERVERDSNNSPVRASK